MLRNRPARLKSVSSDRAGGRYGGFWQAMSSDERREHILIEDDWCVELDYGQMSLAILYGLTGTKPPEGDLYDLSADESLQSSQRQATITRHLFRRFV